MRCLNLTDKYRLECNCKRPSVTEVEYCKCLESIQVQEALAVGLLRESPITPLVHPMPAGSHNSLRWLPPFPLIQVKAWALPSLGKPYYKYRGTLL